MKIKQKIKKKKKIFLRYKIVRTLGFSKIKSGLLEATKN